MGAGIEVRFEQTEAHFFETKTPILVTCSYSGVYSRFIYRFRKIKCCILLIIYNFCLFEYLFHTVTFILPIGLPVRNM